MGRWNVLHHVFWNLSRAWLKECVGRINRWSSLHALQILVLRASAPGLAGGGRITLG